MTLMQIIISHWHCSLKLRWQKAMHFHQPKFHASQILWTMKFFKHDHSSSGVKERTLVFIAHSFAASLEPANWLSNSRVLNSRDKCTLKMQTYINVCSCYSFSLDCQLTLWFIIYILGKKEIRWTVQFWSFRGSHKNHLRFYQC